MNIDLSILDTLIALVIVVLLLSLIVQTVQSVFKKLLKIKSRQIAASLLDLFQNALQESPALPTGLQALWRASPVMRVLGREKPPATDPTKPSAYVLRQETLKIFEGLGRIAQSGRPMLDSLAKSDLMLSLTRLKPEHLLGSGPATVFLKKFKDTLDEVKTLATAIDDVGGNVALQGEASATFGAFRAAITPLLNDGQALLTSSAFSGPASSAVIHDLLNLRQVSPRQAMDLLAAVGKQIGSERASLAAAGQPTVALDGLLTGLKKIIDTFGWLQREFDAATSALRTRITAVEQWFDTVMQSFDERYARGMKTWGIVIAFAVVVVLNANFFRIYSQISDNPVLRQQLVDQGEKVKQLAADVNKLAAQNQSDAGTTVKINETVQSTVAQLKQENASYTSMGFQPLGGTQIVHWWKGPWDKDWLRHTLSALGGWVLMTLLLSAGAPFWEDTLESLFGLKNMLRKSTDTRTVEAKSGAGQPKS